MGAMRTMKAAMKKAGMKKAAMKTGMKKAAMKKGMKAMKKAMKKPMKKVMKVSKIAKGKRARAAVFSGTKEKTLSGMTKSSLIKSKTGRIVGKKRSAESKKRFATSALKKWCDACKKARKELGIKGFCPVGGKTAQGKALYAKVKSLLA